MQKITLTPKRNENTNARVDWTWVEDATLPMDLDTPRCRLC